MLIFDRTDEFRKLYDKMRQASQQYRPLKEVPPPQSTFQEAARNISTEMASTVEMLEQLTKLIKQQSTLDSQNYAVNNLTYQIKERLASHKGSLDKLQEYIQNARSRHSQESKHAETIVSSLNSKLSYSFKQFQGILKTRSKSVRTSENQMKRFGFTSPVANAPGLITPNAPNNTYSAPPAYPYPNQSQMQGQMTFHQLNQDHILQRNQSIQQIESDMVQLSGMFNQLAIMIKEQGELTQTIERNVATASHYADQAQSELMKYFRRLSSNRGLVVKIFVVLLIFLAILGGVLFIV